MSATPRLRSGFPATPATVPRRQNLQETPSTVGTVSSNGNSAKSPTLPLAPENNTARRVASDPLIPLTFLDAPQQRLYALAVYVLLWAWKLYDWLQVIEDGDSSWWLFIKWIFIDFAFLFGLPELRIPWLELSQFIVTTLFAGHVVFNYMLMFNIPVSLLTSTPSWDHTPTSCPINELTFSTATMAGLAPRLCQGLVRSRNLHFRAQRKDLEHFEQSLVNNGQTNHQHSPRRLCRVKPGHATLLSESKGQDWRLTTNLF